MQMLIMQEVEDLYFDFHLSNTSPEQDTDNWVLFLSPWEHDCQEHTKNVSYWLPEAPVKYLLPIRASFISFVDSYFSQTPDYSHCNSTFLRAAETLSYSHNISLSFASCMSIISSTKHM